MTAYGPLNALILNNIIIDLFSLNLEEDGHKRRKVSPYTGY
jgi:hypothetical protein